MISLYYIIFQPNFQPPFPKNLCPKTRKLMPINPQIRRDKSDSLLSHVHQKQKAALFSAALFTRDRINSYRFTSLRTALCEQNVRSV